MACSSFSWDFHRNNSNDNISIYSYTNLVQSLKYWNKQLIVTQIYKQLRFGTEIEDLKIWEIVVTTYATSIVEATA